MQERCERCDELEVDGLVHVPTVGPDASPGTCEIVTTEQLDAYLRAHCANCGGALEAERVHEPIGQGACRVVHPGSEPVPRFDVADFADAPEPPTPTPVALQPIPLAPLPPMPEG